MNKSCKIQLIYICVCVSYPNPSCLQTTSASLSSHWSSHTVPHCPAWYTSTLPSYADGPPERRTGTNTEATHTHTQLQVIFSLLESIFVIMSVFMQRLCECIHTLPWRARDGSRLTVNTLSPVPDGAIALQ